MTARRIMAYLVELDLVDPEDDPGTLYFSDVPVRPWPSTDPDRPGQAYDPRVLEVPTVALELFADADRLTGAIGTSELMLANADGALNLYRGWVFKAVRVWWGEIKGPGEPRSFAADFRQVLDARAETPRWSVSGTQPSRLAVPIYDRRADLATDIQPLTFDGSNSGTDGYEGTPHDIGGQPKPMSLGDLQTANIPILWVNGEAQVGQAHAGEIQGYTGIFDRGEDANLTDDGDVDDATFDAATPSIEHYTTNHDRGLVRVNQNFGGVVTVGLQGAVDLVAGAGYLDTAADLIEALILRQDPAATIGDTFAGIGGAEKVGLYLPDRTQVRQVIDALARALPGWVLPDPVGTWQIGRLHLPTGVADRTIEPTDILSITPGDPTVSVPVWRVTVKGGRLYQTHNRSNLAGSLWKTTEEDRLRVEWRQAVVEDTDLRDRWWPNVREVVLETPLRDPSDLGDVAQLLFDCMSVRADATPFEELVVTTEMDSEWLDLLADPGVGQAEVRLVYPDDGIDRVMLVLGARPGRPKGNQITLRLWG